ncbi:MAG: VCBS repeat-containing protein [Flavobacteriaceae bacterium]
MRCRKQSLYALIPVLILVLSCSQKKKKLFVLQSARESGILFNNKIVETDSFNILSEEYIFNGGGVAIGDFNNDSLPDIFFTGNQVSNALYLNKGALRFEDISAQAGIQAKGQWCTGISAVDINNDGWLDAYISVADLEEEKEKKNLLFINQGINGDGIPTFIEQAGEYGIDDPYNSMGNTFFDYDLDGDLDLYILNNEQTHTLPLTYREKIVDGSAASNDKLYRNEGNGRFTNVTAEAGITYEGFGLGLAISDLDKDGWPDIYVGNDYITNDLLYMNNADGTFTNKADSLIKHQSKFSMGNDIADMNNDGFMDVVTLDMLGETNYRMKTTISENSYTSYQLDEKWDYERQYMRNMLHLGAGQDVPFSEIGLLSGIAKTDWSWSPLFVDMDNDGHKDLLITNGFPRDITDKDFADFRFQVGPYMDDKYLLDSIPVVKIPNYAYRNNGNLTFSDVGDKWGLNIPSFSNGSAFADLDNDGDLDYVVNNINENAFLFENTLDAKSGKNNYIKLILKGKKGNPNALGAKIVVRYDSGFQYHEQWLTRGYMSSMEPSIHIGLGDQDTIRSVEVLWPDGQYSLVPTPNVNSTYTLAYKAANTVDKGALTFPLVPKQQERLFTETTSELLVAYVHEEKDIVDYHAQRLLPHKLSQNGPCLAKGDLNGDGMEDFIIGSSSGHSPKLFFQNPKQEFTEKALFSNELDMKYEEEDMALFDLENDGDLDLYLVSGSIEFARDSTFFKDRLFINDGKGNFVKSEQELPTPNAIGSVVASADFDNDGYIDVFVGGRSPFLKYPYPDESYLLKNDQGILKNVTQQWAPGLEKIGMVTHAQWGDLNSDGFQDLVVVGECMPITVFMNRDGTLQKQENNGLDSLIGWWEQVHLADMDNDGDMDMIAGNFGKNNFYQPTKEYPVRIIAKDFDNNGNIDPITFSYLKNQEGEMESYPVHFWKDLYSQSPLFRNQFNYYRDYADITFNTLLDSTQTKDALQLMGNYDRSTYFENKGDGSFQTYELPMQAQFAPINGIVTMDLNQDSLLDLVLIGNDFGGEVFIGQYDAFNGLVLINKGNGHFKPMATSDSGFLASGDAKDIITIQGADKKDYIIVAQNRGPLLIYRKRG